MIDLKVIVFCLLFLCRTLLSLELVYEGQPGACEEINFVRKITFYKVPTVLAPVMVEAEQLVNQGDYHRLWDLFQRESAVLTTVKGQTHLIRLGPPTEFKNFGVITHLYELADPRFVARTKVGEEDEAKKETKAATVLYVQFCAGDSNQDGLAMVLEKDFLAAQIAGGKAKRGLPPSIHSIPELKD